MVKSTTCMDIHTKATIMIAIMDKIHISIMNLDTIHIMKDIMGTMKVMEFMATIMTNTVWSMHLMASIMSIMVRNLDIMVTGTMDTDMAIIEESMVTWVKNKDTWISAGLDKQATQIMEKGGPTALVMELNPYWQEMLTKMHMKKPTKLLIRKLPIKLRMK
jgi:hypothetical protein